jgi:NTP pyrophosphatase (non-canonical NTP hydrolase)
MLVPSGTIATRSALETYGDYEQSQIAVEELAELIVALKQYERKRIDRSAVCEEIADVCVVLAQLVDVFGRGEVTRIAEEKQNRLMQRIVMHASQTTTL